MLINNKEVKSIRPMTNEEKEEYTRNRSYINATIWCIEFLDGTLLLPKRNCITCMEREDCLFSLANKMP